MFKESNISVIPLFQGQENEDLSKQEYCNIILCTLKKILPPDFFEQKDSDKATYDHQRHILQQVIPLISCSNSRKFPSNLSFFVLSRYRVNSFKFFFEMISRWLNPGRQLKVSLVYASDFRLLHLSDDVYTICEVIISVADHAEFEEIQRNFPIIETEIALGIHSEFFAKRILEIKGLSADDKTALIQGFIAYLVKRFPQHYGKDVFCEMQHVLVTCRDDFKTDRQPRHLSRIISIQYLFRKALLEAIKKSPHRRHLSLKIFRALIQTPLGLKRILSVLVGVSFLRDQENFGEKHLLKAIQHFIKNAVAINNSFFIHKLGSENICISYIEVEKEDGSRFSEVEIRKLRKELPSYLKNRIEHRLHNLFMPRNEEEVMRNIVTLTNQIKYVRDIPQVLINFDEQAYAHLYFTVILARLLKPGSSSISELFKKTDTRLIYLHERTKIMGYRKKYAKEATVFRLKVSKEEFLRADHSIDLYKARQTVVKELSNIIGEIRDFNGGMISKQHELLSAIRDNLNEMKEYDELLLENFFYSLAPVVIRALVDPLAFKKLFLMLLEGLKEYKQEGCYFKNQIDSLYLFSLIILEDFSVRDRIHQAIQNLHIPDTELAYAYVKTHGNICMGYICWVHDHQKKEQFLQVINQSLASPDIVHVTSKKS